MNENKTNINSYPGHMAKTKRLVNEQEKIIDIVYEIIDARIPYSSKIAKENNLLNNKPHILIFNKIDLCDMKATSKWIKYYKDLGYHVITMSLKEKVSFKSVIDLTNSILEDKIMKKKASGINQKEIKALVMGIPNVGKSTFINHFVGRQVANTGNKPGVTKSITWLKTNSNILLLDTPGILWPKITEERVAYNLASFSAIKEENIPVPKVAYYILNMLDKYYPEKLQRYGLEKLTDDVESDYNIIGKKMGLLTHGGEVDYNKINLRIINDIRKENIKEITFD